MTIQMLRTWNGLEEESVYTLAPAEETRLIGLGLARDYVPGQDGVSAGSGTAIQSPVSEDAVTRLAAVTIPEARQVRAKSVNAPEAFGRPYSFQVLAEVAKAVGGAYGHIAFAGDSTAAGTGTTDPDNHAVIGQLRTLLAAQGVPSAGTGLVPMYRETGSSLWWTASGWSDFGRITGMKQGSSAITFAPTMTGTAVRIMYGHSGASFDVAIDGGAAVRVTTNSTSTFGFYTVTGLADALHSVVITPVGGNSHIYAAEVYRSSGLRCSNFGVGGAKSNEAFSSSSWFHHMRAVVASGAKVCFMRGWVNDIGAGYTTAQTVANMTSAAAFLVSNGVTPIVLTHCFFENNNAAVSAAALAVAQAAANAGYLTIDSNAFYGTYEQALANGFTADGVHPNRVGYGFEAVATKAACWL